MLSDIVKVSDSTVSTCPSTRETRLPHHPRPRSGTPRASKACVMAPDTKSTPPGQVHPRDTQTTIRKIAPKAVPTDLNRGPITPIIPRRSRPSTPGLIQKGPTPVTPDRYHFFSNHFFQFLFLLFLFFRSSSF